MCTNCACSPCLNTLYSTLALHASMHKFQSLIWAGSLDLTENVTELNQVLTIGSFAEMFCG